MDDTKYRPSKELESLFALSREIAIEEKKYAISPECFIYAFLCNSGLADQLFDADTKNELIATFYKKLEEEKIFTDYWSDESIPIHLSLAEILKNANYYKNQLHETEYSPTHVLMSILSYENFTSKLFSEKGIIYLDVAKLTNEPTQFLESIKRAHYVGTKESKNIIDGQSDAYDITLQFAKQIAIEKKKYAVSPACFFLALLQVQEIQNSIISENQKEILIGLLNKVVDNDFSFDEFTEIVPNNVELVELIHHARFFKNELYENKLSTKHLLLAALSFENKVSDIFSKKGIIYDDITDMDKRKKEFLLHLKRPPQIPLNIQINYSEAQIAIFSDETKQEQLKVAKEYAWKYLKYNDFEESENCCNYILRLSPENDVAYYILGLSQYKKKNYEVSIDFFKKIPNTSAQHKNAIIMIGSVFAKQKKYNLAKDLALKRLETEPQNCDLLNTIGFYFVEMNDYQQAFSYLEKSIELDDNPHPYAYDNLGYCYFLTGEFGKAIELIQHSLTLDKGNSFAYKNLALVYQSLGNYEKMKESLLIAKHFGYTEKYDDQVDEMLFQLNKSLNNPNQTAKKWFNIFKRKH